MSADNDSDSDNNTDPHFMLNREVRQEHPLRLLIVDDESNTLNSLERLFLNDFLITKAKSVSGALKVIDHKDPPAIALVDYLLPDGSGLDVLQKLQLACPSTVRILLSGVLNLEELVAGVNASMIHRIFKKPWDNTELRVQLLECRQLHFLLQERNKLEQLSITDAVTNLTNHRFFKESLKKEYERAKRHSRPLSLLMIDLDNFKKFNDQQGHPEGDRLLQKIAQTFVLNLRTMDSVSRYGGDEFAIILPDTKKEEAFEVGERLRILVESQFSIMGISMSAGLASCPPFEIDLLDKADKALYTAKKKGRNQIVIANDRQ